MPDPKANSTAADLVPLGLRRATAYAWRILLLVGVGVLVLYVLSRLQTVVLPIIVALLLAALVDPLADRLRATRLPNWLVALVILLGLVALFVGVGLLIVPEVVGQISEVNVNLAEGFRQIERFVLGIFPVSEAQLEQGLSQAFGDLQSRITNLVGQVLGIAGVAGQLILGLVIALFLLFFFVKDGPRFYRWVCAVVPDRRRRDVEELLPQVWQTLRAYLVGVVIVGLFDAVLIGLALLIVGVPLVLPLAVLTFFAAFFPLVGAIVAGGVAALVALVSGGIGDALIIVGATVVVQQIEGNLLQPLIMGRQVELHPAVTLLSVTAGGIVAGIAGAFLAVPVAAVTRRVFRYASPRLAEAGDAVRGSGSAGVSSDAPPVVEREAVGSSSPGPGA